MEVMNKKGDLLCKIKNLNYVPKQREYIWINDISYIVDDIVIEVLNEEFKITVIVG